jgi:glycosyltransferase involved in cell wall biosynthesis
MTKKITFTIRMKVKKASVAVTNDLYTDQRVHRSCTSLMEEGFSVTLYGRKLASSLPLEKRPYRTVRMKLPFSKGWAFYASYNIALFFRLLFTRTDLIFSNDLDTLPACYLVARIRRKPIIYDSHEYFTGVPELIGRPRIRKVWKHFEMKIFPRLKTVITVNDSIAKLYEQEYGVKATVIRNVPPAAAHGFSTNRDVLKLPADKKIAILQGSGINIGRGAEEAVLAMKSLENVVLLIVGGGDVMPVLKRMADEHRLTAKVLFVDRQPPDVLRQYTRVADVGLSLDKALSPNYLYSLPNKLFDYIHAGLPVLVSDLPEVRNIVQKYNIGRVVSDHRPETIAAALHSMLSDEDTYCIWKKNLIIAASELNWENEKILLSRLIRNYA